MMHTVKQWKTQETELMKKNEKDHSKSTPRSSCMSQKILENDLVAICKSTVTLTLNKPTYVGMCILDLSKVLM